ncbi:MAG: polysaccharide deacetylase family protein [Ignavibacteria bacterium]|nr:polysaccharide deacetylase family protein [Ignavibacteria bacterium]
MRIRSSIQILIFVLSFNTFAQLDKPKLSITIDDPVVDSAGLLDWHQKDDSILNTLDKYNIKAALFVCGKRIDNEDGRSLLNKWNSKGHMICNHSYSHSYFHSKKITLQDFEYDFLRCDSIIRNYSNFTPLFRYPYLKEGNTPEKRDGFRNFLKEHKYENGYVSIDASDWYIDSRIKDTLKADPEADLKPYKEYYLQHIYNRAMFYDSLALEFTGGHVKHTLLLHHNLVNAMYLDELLKMFIDMGWEIVDAKDAFSDDVFSKYPDILPAGESIIWALAKESGKYENRLRYPGEDAEYEEEALNKLVNSYLQK